MAKYAVNSESLTAVADAIRAKTGGTELLLFPDGMVEAISGMGGGGVFALSGTTATCVGEVYYGVYTASAMPESN